MQFEPSDSFRVFNRLTLTWAVYKRQEKSPGEPEDGPEGVKRPGVYDLRISIYVESSLMHAVSELIPRSRFLLVLVG